MILMLNINIWTMWRFVRHKSLGSLHLLQLGNCDRSPSFPAVNRPLPLDFFLTLSIGPFDAKVRALRDTSEKITLGRMNQPPSTLMIQHQALWFTNLLIKAAIIDEILPILWAKHIPERYPSEWEDLSSEWYEHQPRRRLLFEPKLFGRDNRSGTKNRSFEPERYITNQGGFSN